MALAEFLKNLEAVAASPYAFAAYIAVVAAWVYTSVARHRLKKIAEMLENLPPEDRTRVLLKEYSTVPRSGLSANQWIASRRHTLFFLGFLAIVVCVTIVVVVALARTAAPNAGSEQGNDSGAVIGVLAAQSQRILELERRVQASEAQATELKASLAGTERSKATPALVALMQDLNRTYLSGAAQVEFDAMLADPTLTDEDKATIGRMLLMKRIDADIKDQTGRVNTLQALRRSGDERSGAEIDRETMKLKKFIDKRSQMFDLLRQTIDKYNQTAKAIIDSIGR